MTPTSADVETSPEPPVRWGIAGWVVVMAAFAIGFVNFPLRVVGWNFDHLPGDAGDNRLNNYVLEHGYRWLSGREASFWDIPMFYPVRGVTGWSDAHIGMLPVYAAVRAVGFSPEGAFQGYFLIASALNFVAAAWALRRLGFGAFGTAAGAFLFAYGLPVVARLPHAQLHPRFLVPPAIVFAWEFLRQPRTWRLAAIAACGVGQMYLTVYIGYFLVLLLGAGLVFALLRFRRELPWGELLRPGRRVWLARGGVVFGFGLVGLALLIAHAMGIGVLPAEHVRGWAPTPRSWITAVPVARAIPELVDPAEVWAEPRGEQQLLAGLLPLAALAVGLLVVIRPGALGGRGSVIATAAAAAILVAVFVTRWGDIWPYELLARLPGITGIRVVNRVALVLLFPAGVAVAGLIDACVGFSRRFGWVPAVLAGVIMFTAVVAEQWLTSTDDPHETDWRFLRYPKNLALTRQARIIDAIRQHPAPKLVYVFPSAGDGPLGGVNVQLEAMRAAQDLGLPCVNGWSGYVPPGWDFFPGYRGLLNWLTRTNPIPADRLAGLVVVGEPEPDPDPAFDAAMKAAYPPRLVK